jgi:hypothetical protein
LAIFSFWRYNWLFTIIILRRLIKHVISLLLIFGIAINASSIFAEVNAQKPQETSSLLFRRKYRSGKQFELYQYKTPHLLNEVRAIYFVLCLPLYRIWTNFIQITLKIRAQIYQEIDANKAQQTFLQSKVASTLSSSNLYIA